MVTRIYSVVPAITAFGIMLQLTAPALAQYSPPPSVGDNCNSTSCPPQQGHVTFVPAGMVLQANLSTSISTDVAKPGDLVSAQITQPINTGDAVIPAGSTLNGEVTAAKSGGFLGRAGMLTFKFNSLQLPNGAQVPMSAHIVGEIGKYNQTANGSDTVAGETWKNKVGQTALRGALGAGAGAALGTAIGAIAGHGYTGQAAGRGAWSGAAIGGGVGVADALLLRKGKQVNIASGTPLQLQLDAPMSISINPQVGAF